LIAAIGKFTVFGLYYYDSFGDAVVVDSTFVHITKYSRRWQRY